MCTTCSPSCGAAAAISSLQRRLAVVQVALRYDADQRVLIEINRVIARRRYIRARPARHLPRPRPEEMFAANGGESRLDARVIDANICQHMLGIGTPNNRQFPLFHSVG